VEQEALRAAELEPDGHAWHKKDVVAFENDPAEHTILHVELEVEDDVPSKQLVQTNAVVEFEYWPAGQPEHEPAPEVEPKPAVQVVHIPRVTELEY
jgi:hypothetical protein